MIISVITKIKLKNIEEDSKRKDLSYTVNKM